MKPGGEVFPEGFARACREGDDTVFVALAFDDFDFPIAQIDVFELNAAEFR